MDQALTVDVVPHIPMLRRYALKLARNGPDADDLVQDCLLRALMRGDQFEPGTNLSAWLMTILRNLFFTRYQRGKRVVEVELTPDCDEVSVDASQVHWVELLDTQSALRDLKPDQQRLIQQCGVEGVSYEEAAEAMGVSTGTIRSRLSRARSRLREQVAGRIIPGYLRFRSQDVQGIAEHRPADRAGSDIQAQRVESGKGSAAEPELALTLGENKALCLIGQPDCREKSEEGRLPDPVTESSGYAVPGIMQAIVQKAAWTQSWDISVLYFFSATDKWEANWRGPPSPPIASFSYDCRTGPHRHPRTGLISRSYGTQPVAMIYGHADRQPHVSGLYAEQVASRGGAPPRP